MEVQIDTDGRRLENEERLDDLGTAAVYVNVTKCRLNTVRFKKKCNALYIDISNIYRGQWSVVLLSAGIALCFASPSSQGQREGATALVNFHICVRTRRGVSDPSPLNR